MTLEEAIEILNEARGCGCCAAYRQAERAFPDACPVDDYDGRVDHYYDGACIAQWDSVLRRVLQELGVQP